MTMKKTLLVIILILSAATTVSAQEIYAEIRRNAQSKISDPSADLLVRKFSMFKLEALNYMAIKMREQMPDSTAELLDKEALSLTLFLNIYTQELVKCSKQPPAYQVKVIQAFMDASYSNPLFRDSDKELVHAYFNDGNSLTRFSLDTDWRRAVLAAKEAMRKLK